MTIDLLLNGTVFSQWIWCDMILNKIMIMSLQVLAEKQGMVEGLAFDSEHDNLYWTCNSDSSISRIDLKEKTNVTVHKVVRLAPDDKPRGIALDSCDL